MEIRDNIEQKPRRGAHVLILPYPLQGHLNPLLQFSKRLASKGLKVTVITTSSISSKPLPSQTTLEFVRIFNGFKDGETTDDLDMKRERMKASISLSLTELIDHYVQNKTTLNPTPKMVIYDSFMYWVLDVIKKRGIQGGPFFTQSCMVNSLYYQAYKGALTTTGRGWSSTFEPFLPAIYGLLEVDDLPSFVASPDAYPSITRAVLNQFSNLHHADCVFINTIDKLETEVLNWMRSQWPLKTVRPAIPSTYLDRRLPDDKEYGLSLFNPETDTCISWLDSKENGSVVYFSMGSLASLGEHQMEEIAIGLDTCDSYYFLWVVRASEENKLPPNFKRRTSGRSLVVNWCPQLEVLAHPAVGCFVTHCGWNSTLEAVSLGVPMVALPQWTDQPTNAKCIADLWKVGARVKANEVGIVTREEIRGCIRQVMEGERGKEVKRNAIMWRMEAIDAMDEGGSSDRNILEFASELVSSY